MHAKSKSKAVYLGRFSPFHKGHQQTLDALISQNGLANTLLIIGSSDSYNSRTPFTFEQRKAIIQTLYPDLEIIPFPDVQSELITFDGSTNDIWLENLKKIGRDRGEKFIFYGGSKEDLEVLAEAFDTHILVDRITLGENTSATAVRAALDADDFRALEELLDSRVIAFVQEAYREFKNTGSVLF